jgi:MscS family membrane protein
MHIFKATNIFGEFSLAAIIFFLSFISAYVLRLCAIRLQNKFDKFGKFGWYALFKSIANPMFFFCLTIGLFLCIDVVDSLSPNAENVFSIVQKSSFVLCIFWFAMSYTNRYEKKFSKTKDKQIGGIDKRTLHACMKLCKALIIIIAIIFLMSIFGVDIRGILTVAGIGGAAIGFASRDLLANFFGAIMLFIDKPFSVGDNIKLADGREGKVEYIGWRVTKIRTFDTVCIYLPNSLFSNMFVENLSMRTNRLITQDLRLEYSDTSKVESATKDIRDMLFNHPEICNDKRIDCFLSSFEDSHIKCRINAFTKNISKPEFLDLNQRIMINIAKIIKKHKLEIAFPIRHMKISNK